MEIHSIAGNIARVEQIVNESRGLFSDAQKNECLETLDKVYRSLPEGPFGKFLSDQAQSLYGRVEALYYSSKISSIEERANTLQETEDVLEAEQLLEEISTLMDNYRGSIQEMHALARSKQVLETLLLISTPEQNHIQFLIGESAHVQVFFEDQWYEDLLEIGELVYEGDVEEAKKRFKQLPSSVKKLVRSHSLFQQRGITLQALIYAAYLCVGNGGSFPTEEEAEEFFKEALEIKLSSNSPLKDRVESLSIYPGRS